MTSTNDPNDRNLPREELLRIQAQLAERKRKEREEMDADAALLAQNLSAAGMTTASGPSPSPPVPSDLAAASAERAPIPIRPTLTTRAQTQTQPASLGDVMARVLANAKRRREEAEAAWREEREAFLAAGGECFWCRDRGPCSSCERGIAVRDEQIAEERRMRQLALLRDLPPRLMAFTFATFPQHQHPAVAACLDFLNAWDERRSLILRGPVGTGKTGLLASMLHVTAAAWAQDDANTHKLRFTTGPDLMRVLRAGYDDDTYHERMGKLLDVRLLAIDDLGAERPTEWVQEQLFTIVNHRYEHLLPTWITSNYGLDELSERIGPRVMDRLVEQADVITVAGQSLRLRGGKGAR